MALIDTTGRTMRERHGKGREFTGDGKSGRLGFSEFGLAPKEDHRGCWSTEGHGRKHLDHPTHPSPGNGGKRNIKMEHQLYNEERKRQLGKIGLKKLKPSVQREDRPRGKSGAELRSLTSEQRAAMNIRSIVHQDPTSLGVDGAALFELEEKVKREQRVQQAEKARQAFSKPQPNRNPPSSAPSVRSPFAVENDTGSSKYHPTRRHCADPPSASAEPKHQGRSVDPQRYHNVPAPFDTVGAEGAPYPDPPKPAEQCSPAKKHPGRGGVRGQQECPNDLDSVQRKRAACRPHIAPPARKDDVLFGNPSPERMKRGVAPAPVPRTGVGITLLEHHSTPTPAEHRIRTGKAGVSVRHQQSTNLW